MPLVSILHVPGYIISGNFHLLQYLVLYSEAACSRKSFDDGLKKSLAQFLLHYGLIGLKCVAQDYEIICLELKTTSGGFNFCFDERFLC